MGRYLRIAQIVKARKNKGRLVVRPVDGLPFLLSEGLELRIVPPTPEIPCTVTVAEAGLRGDDYVVAFAGVSDPDMLREYVGRSCLALRSDLDADVLENDRHTLKGYALEDVRLGRIGRISAVEQMPGQIMLTVQGRFGEVLVPLADDLVVSLDCDAGVLHMDLPRGLVEGQ